MLELSNDKFFKIYKKFIVYHFVTIFKFYKNFNIQKSFTHRIKSVINNKSYRHTKYWQKIQESKKDLRNSHMKEIQIIIENFSKKTKQKSRQNQTTLKKIFTKKLTKQLQLHWTNELCDKVRQRSKYIKSHAKRTIQITRRILIIIIMRRNDNWKRKTKVNNKSSKEFKSNSQHRILINKMTSRTMKNRTIEKIFN